MPLYEYECSKCAHRFEQLVRSSGDKIVCPACGCRKVEKCFSTFAMGGRSQSADGCAGTCSGEGGGGSCAGCSGGNCSCCH